MSHGKEVCACGAIISQCRCRDHTVTTVVCQTCPVCAGRSKEAYPEHEKQAKLTPKIAVVAGFLEWLRDQGFVVAVWDQDRFRPVKFTHPDLIANHFGIDQKKIGAEKDAMLEEMRRDTRAQKRPPS